MVPPPIHDTLRTIKTFSSMRKFHFQNREHKGGGSRNKRRKRGGILSNSSFEKHLHIPAKGT